MKKKCQSTHVTNGVHTATWLARRLRHLFDRYLGADWMDRIDDPDVWELVNNIPDDQLWEVRQHLKRKLIAYMRERARQRWRPGGWHPIQVVGFRRLIGSLCPDDRLCAPICAL